MQLNAGVPDDGTIVHLCGTGRKGVSMPISVAIYGSEFPRHIDQGLAPEQFRWRFLAEGDSWMERSSAFTASLPDYLAREMEAAHEPTLIVNLALFGDTMRRIGEVVEGDFAQWVNFMAFDAILLSAGGNDFIDAARDPDPGQGLLRDLRGQPQPSDGYDCVRPDALRRLVEQYLEPNFRRLYDAVRASAVNAGTPIFLNSYDTPVARPAPAPPGTRAWLHAAYVKNGIDASLWPRLTAGIFDDLDRAIVGWGSGRTGVHVVPTRGTLAGADPAAAGDSGDWINEIHPNRSGWKKLAPVWRQTIRSVI